jgi:glycerol-3-phosphate dehydrogenase
MADYDLAIIGGGINGTGIARDAAGRGLRVLLVEQGDLAAGTSSASSKLIHGGLRYLEQRAFRLVREALAEREVLLTLAPQLVRPIRFVLPAYPGPRSALLLRIGLFLYDHLGGKKILPATRTLDLTHHPMGYPLNRRYRFGFEYSDCTVDDSRLVILNAIDAAERGAVIRTRTRCVRAERSDEWRLILTDHGRRDEVTARVLVNAAGPWAGIVMENVLRVAEPKRLRLVKGSHIVVPRMFQHDRAYILQSTDGRVVFVLPFERDFTLIGTTDNDFVGDLAALAPTGEEITYLFTTVNNYFRHDIGPLDVKWAFSGVRSLHDDGSRKPEDVTRDYHLMLDERFREAPVLTVYGGKITTYRRLAEQALTRLAPYLRMGEAWTARAPLPGGAFAVGRGGDLVRALRAAYPFLSELHAERLVNAYGTRAAMIVTGARRVEDLGHNFGYDLTEAEVKYLMAEEWAISAGDVLWRRSRLGLRFSTAQTAALDAWMAAAHRRADAPVT